MDSAASTSATIILELPRSFKRLIVLAVDTSLCVLSVWLAFYLRLGEFSSLSKSQSAAVYAAILTAIPTFIVFGLYRTIFRFSGLTAMLTVMRAMLVYGLIYATLFTVIAIDGIPRTIGLIQPILLFLFVGASRAFASMGLGGLYQGRIQRAALPQLLIYGAGSAGRQMAAAMANSQEMRVVGFLDDDDRLHGHVLNGLPIYNPQNLSKVLAKVPVTDVLLALPSATRQRRNNILTALTEHQLAVRTLPNLSDIASGKVSLSHVRDLDIDDLLGREPVKPNGLLLHRNTHGKSVLVTGAGGSIGSELCRQIIKCQPRQLLMVEMSEFALYQIHQELMGTLAALQSDHETMAIELVPLLASVCDEVRMKEIMSTWRPHTVYHAAAYKHVPLVEHNPTEGLRNNVLGTLVCAQMAAQNGVLNFVLISTDKAVRSTNIMGATKRLSEMVLQALAVKSRTNFSMVRFGNVLGSSGSVVPLFREQIKNGGPITLTHQEVTRYFMTITEAAELVIQAGAMSTGGDVYVLDMGQPVRIADLAKRMVELSGLTLRDAENPDGDIEITLAGLRPGEKLFEELLIGNNPKSTQHIRIMKANEEFLHWDVLQLKLNALKACMKVNDAPALRGILQELVPSYKPTGEVVDWVSLAKHEKKHP